MGTVGRRRRGEEWKGKENKGETPFALPTFRAWRSPCYTSSCGGSPNLSGSRVVVVTSNCGQELN